MIQYFSLSLYKYMRDFLLVFNGQILSKRRWFKSLPLLSSCTCFILWWVTHRFWTLLAFLEILKMLSSSLSFSCCHYFLYFCLLFREFECKKKLRVIFCWICYASLVYDSFSFLFFSFSFFSNSRQLHFLSLLTFTALSVHLWICSGTVSLESKEIMDHIDVFSLLFFWC